MDCQDYLDLSHCDVSDLDDLQTNRIIADWMGDIYIPHDDPQSDTDGSFYPHCIHHTVERHDDGPHYVLRDIIGDECYEAVGYVQGQEDQFIRMWNAVAASGWLHMYGDSQQTTIQWVGPERHGYPILKYQEGSPARALGLVIVSLWIDRYVCPSRQKSTDCSQWDEYNWIDVGSS
jgi:hypothetical protein